MWIGINLLKKKLTWVPSLVLLNKRCLKICDKEKQIQIVFYHRAKQIQIWFPKDGLFHILNNHGEGQILGPCRPIAQVEVLVHRKLPFVRSGRKSENPDIFYHNPSTGVKKLLVDLSPILFYLCLILHWRKNSDM